MRMLDDRIRERRVCLGEVREGLGRLQFVAGPFEHLRPFLGPLYAWASAGRRWAHPRLPVMIFSILKFIGKELRRCRMAECPRRTKDLGEVFRLDAKAEGEEVAFGGWRCLGAKPTKDAQWFAVRLNRRNALGPSPAARHFERSLRWSRSGRWWG